MRPVESHQNGLELEATKSNEGKPKTDFVSLLSQILTHPKTLECFIDDSAGFIRQFEISENDREALLSLEPDQIRNQADTLLNKRWHEVRKLIPITIAGLDEQGSDLFRFYAANQWPEGHCRHLIDACGFLKFIKTNNVGNVDTSEKRNVRRQLRMAAK